MVEMSSLMKRGLSGLALMREELNDAMTDCKVEKLDIFSSEKIPERIEEICQKLSRSMFHESKTRGKMEPDNAIYQAAEYGHHNAIIGIGKWKMGVRQTGHPKKYEFNTLSGKEFEEGFSYFLRLRHPRFDKKYDRDSKSKRNGCEKSVDDVRVLLDLSSYTNLRDLDELVEGGIPHLYNEEDSLQSRLQMFDSTFAAYEKERYLPAMCLLVVQFWYDYWMVRKGQEMEDYGKVMGIDVKTEVSSLLAAEAEEVPAINDAKACDEKYRETYYGMHVKHLFKLKALKVLEEIREIISTSKNGQSGFATMTEEQANKLTCDLLCQLGHKLYIDNLTYGKNQLRNILRAMKAYREAVKLSPKSERARDGLERSTKRLEDLKMKVQGLQQRPKHDADNASVQRRPRQPTNISDPD